MYFSTNENLRLLATAETIYVDGTFKICPRLFYQVFTINAFVHGHQFLLVYGLLDRTCGITTDTVVQGQTISYRGWHNHMKREEEKGD